MTRRLPFQERKSAWRAVLDVLTGCYPAFVWGGPLGNIVPVFHFHDVTREELEPALRYLKTNGYRTVTSEAMRRWTCDKVHPGPKSVALCFDDAWTSMWTVVTPLLKAYDLSAITYVVPGRVADADDPRPATEDGAPVAGPPLATWPEIQAMHASGHVDVQAHTLSHAKLFCSATPLGFITPQTHMTLLGQPVVACGPPVQSLDASMLGAPLYLARSAMSDALAYVESDAARQACMAHVAAHGGATFFQRSGWRQELSRIATSHPGRFESAAEREQRQLTELTQARELLMQRLPGHEVGQICFPWGVASVRAIALAQQAGYTTAVADRLWGRRAMGRGTDPFHIMRLKNSYIFALPGQGRRLPYRLRKGN